MADTPRTTFALLCLLGVVIIGTGAVLEVTRARRGDSVVRPGQLRLRMMSAIVWVIILGSLSYAVLFLWPVHGDREQARRFLAVVSGAILLFGIAMLLLIYDVWQLGRERRLQEARFNMQLAEMARSEAARVKSGNIPTQPTSELPRKSDLQPEPTQAEMESLHTPPPSSSPPSS